ncbi:MAG: enoyl-CoA hydratase/isomerase family protein [Acidimicrobiia bacterium]|nr:enoyl-CoA hydratase/isomerase family protein [Acidimicrobiia bacterium]MYE73769.1 enoyl-CoA hydratase/isomerase family protein [Acidimicrobiia bacterium]MYJ62612.1 enoyl-CoA hydratase/isomerase family protein [Acidimicrobiia bacterium]
MSSPVLATGLAEAKTLLSLPYAGEDFGLADCPVILVELTAADLSQWPSSETADLVKSTPAVMVASVPDDRDPADASKLAEICDPFDIVLASGDLEVPLAVAADEVDQIAAAAAASPAAAVALVQLLRLSQDRSTADGLVAESLAYSTLQSGPQFQGWLASQPSRLVPDNPEPAVLAERAGSTLRLTLNRPERHNAFSAEMRDGLVEQLRAAWADPTLDGIVLDGTGPTFCSGGDLAEFGTTPDPGTAHRVRSVRSAAFWIDRLAAKTRAMVHGTCVGAGVELPAYAHDVAAHPDTTFRLPEVAMGLVPGAGGTVSIARRIGRQRLGYFALTNTEIDATTALAWGLIDRIED